MLRLQVLVYFLLPVCFISLLAEPSDISLILASGDAAFEAKNHPQALRYYQQAVDADSMDYEANWKFSRALVDVGETIDNKNERRDYYQRAERAARRAIISRDDGAKGHLFLSISLGRVALDSGAKERVKLSREIRDEAERALELDSMDDIAWHVLGRWHRKLSSLSWVEKKFANIFYGGVPKDASIESAADCFRKALAINPNSIAHHLELGLTYEKLKKKDLAAAEYQTVLILPVTDSEDPQHQQTAAERLKKLD